MVNNPLNYIAWINIFALAVNLFNEPEIEKQITIETYWDHPVDFNFSSQEYTEALFIDFYHKNSEKLIQRYLFFPWQDLFPVNKPGISANITVPKYTLYAVNRFAISFKSGIFSNDQEHADLLEKINSRMKLLFDADFCMEPINKNGGKLIPEGLQAIRINEYPFFVDIQTAIPGSKPIHPEELKQFFVHKMVLLSQIPDIGPIRKQWIKSGDAVTDTCFLQNQDTIINLFIKAINNLNEDESMDNHSQIINMTMLEIENRLKSKDCYSDATLRFCFALLERFSGQTTVEPKSLDSHFPFGDYQPKTTPDNLVDYMPSLYNIVKTFPSAEPENLPKLAGLYKEYRKQAKQDKGEWIEGNMILGAKPEEYLPTQEELILGEIGERIHKIVKHPNQQLVNKVIREHKVRPKNIKYTHFEFIHYDVMGSGRFFYIESMDEIKINLRKLSVE